MKKLRGEQEAGAQAAAHSDTKPAANSRTGGAQSTHLPPQLSPGAVAHRPEEGSTLGAELR